MAHTNITRLDLRAAISVVLLTAAIVVIAAILLLSPAAHAATGVPACSARAGSLVLVLTALGGGVMGFLASSLFVVGGPT
jgi:hypothetical protein